MSACNIFAPRTVYMVTKSKGVSHMKKAISLTLILMFVMVSAFALTGCGKKKCAKCGKTEDEVQLFLFDTSTHPGGDGKYYCSACYGQVYSETPVPGVADEIAKVIE